MKLKNNNKLVLFLALGLYEAPLDGTINSIIPFESEDTGLAIVPYFGQHQLLTFEGLLENLKKIAGPLPAGFQKSIEERKNTLIKDARSRSFFAELEIVKRGVPNIKDGIIVPHGKIGVKFLNDTFTDLLMIFPTDSILRHDMRALFHGQSYKTGETQLQIQVRNSANNFNQLFELPLLVALLIPIEILTKEDYQNLEIYAYSTEPPSNNEFTNFFNQVLANRLSRWLEVNGLNQLKVNVLSAQQICPDSTEMMLYNTDGKPLFVVPTAIDGIFQALKEEGKEFNLQNAFDKSCESLGLNDLLKERKELISQVKKITADLKLIPEPKIPVYDFEALEGITDYKKLSKQIDFYAKGTTEAHKKHNKLLDSLLKVLDTEKDGFNELLTKLGNVRKMMQTLDLYLELPDFDFSDLILALETKKVYSQDLSPYIKLLSQKIHSYLALDLFSIFETFCEDFVELKGPSLLENIKALEGELREKHGFPVGALYNLLIEKQPQYELSGPDLLPKFMEYTQNTKQLLILTVLTSRVFNSSEIPLPEQESKLIIDIANRLHKILGPDEIDEIYLKVSQEYIKKNPEAENTAESIAEYFRNSLNLIAKEEEKIKYQAMLPQIIEMQGKLYDLGGKIPAILGDVSSYPEYLQSLTRACDTQQKWNSMNPVQKVISLLCCA